MDISVLQTYLHVVEEGSFAAAARRMSISKSQCSKYISDLEKSLGVRLLSRTTRSVKPSTAGADYYLKVKDILASLSNANEAVRSLSSSPSGKLRLATPVGYMMAVLRPHMLRFMEEFPDVQLDAVLEDRVSDPSMDGMDAAISIGWLADSSLVARHLHDICVFVVATPDYLERHGTPVQPADLVQHQCLHFSNLRGSSTWPFRDGEETIHQKIHPVFSTNNIDLIRAAALDGRGIALLPDHSVRADLEAGTLVRVLRAHALPPLPVHLVYPTRRHISAALRAFIDFTARMDWADAAAHS